MKQVWKIGDCLELMRELPEASRDLIITDPPYNLGKDYGKTTDDNQSVENYWEWFRERFAEAHRVMTDGYLYVSHSDAGVYTAKPILEDIGFEYLQTLIWYGRNGYSMQSKRKTWSYRHEPILFMQKGNPPPLNDGENGLWYTSVIEVPRPQSNFKEGRQHPTQKPLKLYEILLRRTPCTKALDPFVGSGTMLRACKRLDIYCIGFEINPDYNAVIENGLLFTTPLRKMKQKLLVDVPALDTRKAVRS